MTDKKAERLINLTLALLATRRYLTKNEIFKNVEGYSGNSESMDRMFERDKNELRSLGIDISVGDLDPLFDDEPGYRIFVDDYAFQLKNLEPADIAVLSVAAKLWNDSVLGSDAQAGLLKLESLGLTNDLEDSLTFDYRYENPTNNLIAIENAIFDSKVINFKYKDGSTLREVEPYKIFLWHGFWYLLGRDLGKNEFRSFKISRINGEIEENKKNFKRVVEPKVEDYLPSFDPFGVELELPEGKSAVLRNQGEVISSAKGLDIVRINFSDPETALKEILRHGTDARIISPNALRTALISHLERLANV